MSGYRLDAALAEMLPDYSRSKISSWIKAGNALIEQSKFKPKDKSTGSEIISLNVYEKSYSKWNPENIPLDIVFEDDDIIVINKPYGL